VIELLNPRALFGLVLLAPVLFVAWRMQSVPRWRPVTLLRALALTGLVLALARPAWKLRSNRLTHVVVVDISASVSEVDRARARELVDQLNRRKRQQDLLRVLTVADLVQQQSPSLPPRPQANSPSRSALGAGLEAAAALIDVTTTGRITLATDGLETDQRLALVARQLAAAGVVVDTVPAQQSAAQLLVTHVTAPPFFNAGEQVLLSAEVQSALPTEATAIMKRGDEVVARKPMKLNVGVNRVEFEVTSKQAAEYELTLSNQRVRFTLAPAARLRVLLVESDPRRGVALRDAMAREGVDVVVRQPGAGVADANDFAAVLLGDVSAGELGAASQRRLHQYVQREGGGLVMMGGERSFGPGGFQKTPIAEALPVDFEQERQEQDPSVAMVLIIDTSGSMQGSRLQLAKEIAVRATRHLTPQDRVGVIEFYGSRRWAVPLQRAGDLAAIELVIERLRAAGGTVLYPALEEAYYGLVNVRARYKHVLILSDGDVFPGPFTQLAARMATEGMTVSTVKVAPEGSSVFLQDIGFHGRGRSFDYSGLTVPDINVKQMSRVPQSPFREQPFVPVATRREVEVLKGVDLSRAPPLLGYVTVKPHPKAELVLKTPTGEPLLARWQFGLGRAAAFTSDARDRWASAWLKWDGFGKFWSQLIRDVARDESLPLRVTTTNERDAVRVRLEPETMVSELQAEVVGLSRSEGAGRLHQLGPNLYELSVPQRANAMRTVLVTVKTADGQTKRTTVSLPSQRMQEFRSLTPDVELLGSISKVTGGVSNPTLEQTLRPGPTKLAWRELWHWCLGFSVLTLLTEVLVRRWP